MVRITDPDKIIVTVTFCKEGEALKEEANENDQG